MSDFTFRVHEAVKRIPRGETRTYKDIAREAGSPKAFRAVGTILSKNFDPAIPCHRVVRSNGETGKYNRGSKRKIQLLQEEQAV